MNDPMSGWVLPASMFSLMLGMGLTLTAADFRRIASVPGPVVVGTLLQLVAMPVLGFALALAYDLPPLLAAGLVIVAACPGGMLSNLAVHHGRANTALSITLTATATTATLLTLPLWVRAILASAGGLDDGTVPEIPLIGTAIELAGLTIVPIGLGMALRRERPSALRFERFLTAIGTIGVIGTVGYDAAVRPDPPIEQFTASFLPALWLALAAATLGFGIPRFLGQSIADSVTVAVEVCLKNGLLGMVVASSTFGVLEASVPIVAYTSLMGPIATVILVAHVLFVRREKKRAKLSS